MSRYLVLDVFSETPFGGNQLAVIPDASALPEGDLQRISAEFNFSETTFVYPPQDPDNTAKVRIFTPTMEVPFAGHPTIGTAVALAAAGHGPDMVLELGVGPIPCHASGGAARFTTTTPLSILAHPDVADVAAALGLVPSQIETGVHAPQIASVGLPFVISQLTDLKSLSGIETDISAVRKGAAKYPGALDFAQFAYVLDGSKIHARMFAPLDNIPEDPATGSAAAALGALLSKITGQDQSLTIHQGDFIARPSRIGVTTKGATVTISGHALLIMEGRLVY